MTNHDQALLDLVAPLAMMSALIGCLFALSIWTILGVIADGVGRAVRYFVRLARLRRRLLAVRT